jgi:AraC family transcriptional regulator
MKDRRGVRRGGGSAESRPALSAQVGDEIVRFQEASKTVDQIAATILRLDQQDLPCMTLLLFGGPATAHQLADALRLPLSTLRDVVARLEMAGYARRSAGPRGPQIELTPHAREWIDRIWEPLRHRGAAMLAGFSQEELSLIVQVLRAAQEVQERYLAELRHWLDEPAATRRSHQRGGLSPAALRRVQLFVEANIETVDPHWRSRRSRRIERPSLRARIQNLNRTPLPAPSSSSAGSNGSRVD